MSKFSRDKGKRGERDVVRHLKAIWPDARRGLQYRDGAECCDVEGTPFAVEVKTQLRLMRAPLREAWEQANKASKGRPPMVAFRETGREMIAMVRMDDLVWLVMNARQGEL